MGEKHARRKRKRVAFLKCILSSVYSNCHGFPMCVIYNALINGQECLEPKPFRFRVCKVISNVNKD